MKTNRLFLVGCPRSGTTLLQSMVASHPQVVSFPETHFFSETLPINPLLRRLRFYGGNSQQFVEHFLSRHGYESIAPFQEASFFYTHNRWCQILLDTIDKMIIDQSKNLETNTVWGLEKTPRHLFYISSIQQKGYPNKFIHILRSGPDVVASLYLATNKFPEQWGGARSVDKCINWWNNSLHESLKYRNNSDHLFATYEQLISEPEIVLKEVCNFLDIDYHESMTSDFHNTANSLTKQEETWKQKNAERSLEKSNKLDQHFSEGSVAYIKEKVAEIDLTQFYF